ncbi:condensation domain-containing protein [Streptomyces griseoruber]|uniref:condensation domain-containing protein n=1 Tax=Streptomyces griseoruber TaxID=1943 RepID=UPI0006E35E20|nr:condensation domain-containing protein [Streptomyces griseoruber]
MTANATDEATADGLPGRGDPAERLLRTLGELWSQALSRDPVGVDEHFLDLGGDSITSVVLSGRAQQAGIPLTPRLIFDHPTLRELAAALHARTADGSGTESGGDASSSSDARHVLAAAHQHGATGVRSLLLRLARPPATDLVEAALDAVMARHDVLRLSLTGSGPQGHRAPVAHHRLSGPTPAARTAEHRGAVQALRARIDARHGPLLAAAHMDRDDGEGAGGAAATLVLAVHEAAADARSHRLLLDELASTCEQLAHGEPVLLPEPTVPFTRWAELAQRWADGPEAAGELGHWLGVPDGTRLWPSATTKTPETGVRHTLSAELTAAQTAALLRDLPVVDGSELLDVLVAAVAHTVARHAGTPTVVLDLDADGRDLVSPDLDFSRTIGPFTATFPLAVELVGTCTAGDRVAAVRTARAEVPGTGAGYAALRRLSSDEEVRRGLTARAGAQIRVGLPPEDGCAAGPLVHISAEVVGDRLRVELVHALPLSGPSPEQLLRETVTELERAAQAPACSSGPSPGAFPLSGLGQDQLAALLSDLTHDPEESRP